MKSTKFWLLGTEKLGFSVSNFNMNRVYAVQVKYGKVRSLFAENPRRNWQLNSFEVVIIAYHCVNYCKCVEFLTIN